MFRLVSLHNSKQSHPTPNFGPRIRLWGFGASSELCNLKTSTDILGRRGQLLSTLQSRGTTSLPQTFNFLLEDKEKWGQAGRGQQTTTAIEQLRSPCLSPCLYVADQLSCGENAAVPILHYLGHPVAHWTCRALLSRVAAPGPECRAGGLRLVCSRNGEAAPTGGSGVWRDQS